MGCRYVLLLLFLAGVFGGHMKIWKFIEEYEFLKDYLASSGSSLVPCIVMAKMEYARFDSIDDYHMMLELVVCEASEAAKIMGPVRCMPPKFRYFSLMPRDIYKNFLWREESSSIFNRHACYTFGKPINDSLWPWYVLAESHVKALSGLVMHGGSLNACHTAEYNIAREAVGYMAILYRISSWFEKGSLCNPRASVDDDPRVVGHPGRTIQEELIELAFLEASKHKAPDAVKAKFILARILSMQVLGKCNWLAIAERIATEMGRAFGAVISNRLVSCTLSRESRMAAGEMVLRGHGRGGQAECLPWENCIHPSASHRRHIDELCKIIAGHIFMAVLKYHQRIMRQKLIHQRLVNDWNASQETTAESTDDGLYREIGEDLCRSLAPVYRAFLERLVLGSCSSAPYLNVCERALAGYLHAHAIRGPADADDCGS